MGGSRSGARVFYPSTRSIFNGCRSSEGRVGIGSECLYLHTFWEPVFTVLPLLALRLGLIRSGWVLIVARREFSPGRGSAAARRHLSGDTIGVTAGECGNARLARGRDAS